MSGHRVELHVNFTVGDASGRMLAEAVLGAVEHLGNTGWIADQVGDFAVRRGTVDGNGWEERWPAKKPPKPNDARELAEQALLNAGFDARVVANVLRLEGE